MQDPCKSVLKMISMDNSLENITGLESLIPSRFREMEAYDALEPPEVLAARAGIPKSQIVKLNGNENPYGPSSKVMEALSNLDQAHIYPDPMQIAMRKAIADYAQVGVDNIVVGNGSDEIIDLLFRILISHGDAVIDCTPTFGMYRFTAKVCGGHTVSVPRTADFSIDTERVLNEVTSSTKAIVIASPNNPTGNSVTEDEVRSLLTSGLFVILDEAYYEFSGKSFASEVGAHPNLIVLRTMSKWAGLAGLRVGYGIMNGDLAKILLKVKPPYNVNQAAEAALLASLEDVQALQERVNLLIGERNVMSLQLGKINGVQPWPSEANFILCQLEPGTGLKTYKGLAEQGVFVRYFSDPRLTDFIRVSVGKPEDTARLIDALHHGKIA